MILAGEIMKIYSLPHVFLIIMLVALIALGAVAVKKAIKTEKSVKVLLIISGAVLLALLIATRISYVWHSIDEGDVETVFDETRKYNWAMLLPDSFCSLIALILPFVLFFGKYKDNKFLEAVYSLALLGALSNIIYPEYLGRQPFFEARTICSILYHVLLGFIFLVLLMTGNLRPRLKNWYYTPLTLACVITFGVFELTCLGFAKAYNITAPLVKGLAISKWYWLVLGYVIFDVICRLAFYVAEKKKGRKGDQK